MTTGHHIVCTLILLCGSTVVPLTSRFSDTTLVPLSLFLQGGYTHPIATNVYCLDDAACTPFQGGSGTSIDLFLATRFRVAERLSLLTAIGGGQWTTTMSSQGAAGRTRDAQGNVVDFIREQTLHAQSTYLSMYGAASYSIDRLRLSIGPRIEVAIGSPTWQQTSRIISPSNVVYPNGMRELTSVPEQEIPSAAHARLSAMGLAEYLFDINGESSIAPYLSLSYAAQSVRTGAAWTDMRIAVGVSIHSSIGFGSTQHSQPIEDVHDPIVQSAPRQALEVETTAVELRKQPPPMIIVMRDSTYTDLNAVNVKTKREQQMFSMLPYVFFDSASASISSRYRRSSSTSEFRPRDIAPDQHSMYLEFLNVLGARMKASTDTILLRGSIDAYSEKSDCRLAQRRAESVRDALVQIWEIDPRRIEIAPSGGECEPVIASPSSTVEGRAENRRVEILSRSRELLSPIVQRDVVVITHAELDSFCVTIRGEDIQSALLHISLRQRDALLAETAQRWTGNCAQLEIPQHVMSRCHPDQPIELRIVGITNTGDTIQWSRMLELHSLTEQRHYRTVSLSMFDFRRSSINARDSALLIDFALRLTRADTVRISGYTDQSGTPAYNDALSMDRASAVARLLRRVRPDVYIGKVHGYGAKHYPPGLDSYQYPEQRMMSRTVRVEVTGKK